MAALLLAVSASQHTGTKAAPQPCPRTTSPRVPARPGAARRGQRVCAVGTGAQPAARRGGSIVQRGTRCVCTPQKSPQVCSTGPAEAAPGISRPEPQQVCLEGAVGPSPALRWQLCWPGTACSGQGQQHRGRPAWALARHPL